MNFRMGDFFSQLLEVVSFVVKRSGLPAAAEDGFRCASSASQAFAERESASQA